MRATESQVHRHLVRSDFGVPPWESKLLLICTSCGTKGRYHVGQIMIDPEVKVDESPEAGEETPSWLESATVFLGYFHCRHCNSPGPWKLPTRTEFALMGALAATAILRKHRRIALGRAHMFDGTHLQTSALSVEYLLGLIEGAPSDSFLWTRLGNTYRNCEQDDLAVRAYERAIELNPRDVEAQHSLGCYRLWQEQDDLAAEHYRLVLRHARDANRVSPALLREMVRHALESLFELNVESEGRIELLSQTDSEAFGELDEPLILQVREFELDSDEDWTALTESFVTGKSPAAHNRASQVKLVTRLKSFRPHPRSTPAGVPDALPDREPAVAEPARSANRPGRNERCPCGSGRKFKHCCG